MNIENYKRNLEALEWELSGKWKGLFTNLGVFILKWAVIAGIFALALKLAL